MSHRYLRSGDREQIAARLRLSNHALRRAAERFIRLTDIQHVIRRGRACPCWLGLRLQLDSSQVVERPSAWGLVVVVVRDGRIATVYRAEV